MFEVQFEGETIEIVNGVWQDGDFVVAVQETREDEWDASVTFLSHGYTRTVLTPFTKPTAQEALDCALEQWDIVSSEARADALDVVAAVDRMDAARAAI